MADGDVLTYSAFAAALGLIAPVMTTLPAAITPGTSMADVSGLSYTKTVGSTSEIYEVVVDVTARVATTGGSLLQLNLVVDGTTQSGGIQVGGTSQSLASNTRLDGTRTWTVTGLAAGSRVFKVQASQSTSSIWELTANSTRLYIKRVA